MSDQQTVEDIQRGWARDAMSSDLGLWWLAADIREWRPGATEDEVRLETLSALRPLLTSGALRAVHLLPGGAFAPWEGTAEEQLARMDAEWAALGRRPDLGDIVWFIGAR
ncbi:hypothetical protein [Melittangium boletus]|uniref:Uncharacterized protein n=1 Tax=Melittangium boletus DSM 14713 TaxID=1294270 RepID=A0A250IMF7_9BACT|nr:hypothetical protein [Melittangium boletus]ATB32458.1 hypothetical protein MEBOL_005938 [Melittangium boletus DSM 14713]